MLPIEVVIPLFSFFLLFSIVKRMREMGELLGKVLFLVLRPKRSKRAVHRKWQKYETTLYFFKEWLKTFLIS
jgi:hypothetical protein